MEHTGHPIATPGPRPGSLSSWISLLWLVSLWDCANLPFPQVALQFESEGTGNDALSSDSLQDIRDHQVALSGATGVGLFRATLCRLDKNVQGGECCGTELSH